MSTKGRKLKVEGSGGRHYIYVASNRSETLHCYLRAHFIPAGPPQPSSSDTDSIVLGRGLDLKAVQALLDRWV